MKPLYTYIRYFFAMLLVFSMILTCFTLAYADVLLANPKNAAKISQNEFKGDKTLDEIMLSDKVKSIEKAAFADSSLKTIFVPDSIKKIADDAFEGIPSLTIRTSVNSYAFSWARKNNDAHRYRIIPYEAVTYNDHTYMIFDTAKSWQEANEICESIGGHLAIIDSAEENEFLYTYMHNKGIIIAYFGLVKDKGVWKWVDGTELSDTYSNWAANEPNNATANEEVYGQFKGYDNKEKGEKAYEWNDCSWKPKLYGVSYPTRFICEWDSN